MDQVPRIEELARPAADQEAETLDDGFPYERIGENAELDWMGLTTLTPTPFMVVQLKQVLLRLRQIYGLHGHWIMCEIGETNLRRPDFVQHIGVHMYWRLFEAAVGALPDDEREAYL